MSYVNKHSEEWEAKQENRNPNTHEAHCTRSSLVGSARECPATVEREAYRESCTGCQNRRQEKWHPPRNGDGKYPKVNTVLSDANDGKADELMKICGPSSRPPAAVGFRRVWHGQSPRQHPRRARHKSFSSNS